MKTHTRKWLKAAGVRAIKTVAQTAIATIGAAAVLSEVNWAVVSSASALAGVLSLIVFLRIPVILARSAWVNRRSPSRVDSKILTIAMLLCDTV